MSDILVTGATGLVGSRLLARFHADGHACRVLVRPGRELPPGVEVAEGDVLAPDTLGDALAGVSTIIHLAASFRDGNDEQTWAVNLTGTQNLIDAARAHAPDARFLMASTSNVYDAGADHPAREDDALHPVLAYPASKARAEEELRASGLTWSILRLPFVYGEGDGHLEAAPRMMARRGWHPAHRMSVAHHADIAHAFAIAVTGAMDGLTVNIADEAPPTLYEIAQIVGETYPASDEPLTDPWHLHVDATLARRLGFRPRVRTVYQALAENLL
ncbi:NAD-dependent epimerase/dehydratase family protein [Actinomycetospora flava]|uniref:NAD(P)-dependent oxidoreductase n=1 Tax=Actinomycetospora flava TaxID=3129232 RepID=A0ABU8MB52_9PSEU